MKLGQHQEIFALHLAKLLVFAFNKGYQARLGELQRMPEMQKIYVETGRSLTMDSRHLKKVAIDIYWFKDGQGPLCPRELGEYWESLDPLNSWGGNWARFKDTPHFERRV